MPRFLPLLLPTMLLAACGQTPSPFAASPTPLPASPMPQTLGGLYQIQFGDLGSAPYEQCPGARIQRTGRPGPGDRPCPVLVDPASRPDLRGRQHPDTPYPCDLPGNQQDRPDPAEAKIPGRRSGRAAPQTPSSAASGISTARMPAARAPGWLWCRARPTTRRRAGHCQTRGRMPC